MGFLPHVLILLSFSHSLSLYIYIPLSLSHTLSIQSLFLSSLSFSLSLIDTKKEEGKGPQSLLQIGGDWGPIETVNLAVDEDVP